MRVTALLTSFNRRDSTLSCLGAYYSQEVPSTVTLTAVLVDDSSSDGTVHEVRCAFPDVTVIQGSGELYWAAGMALGERIASTSDPDYYLWLNDDVVLDRNAVARLLATEHEAGPGRCVVVGAVRDTSTTELTYSGVRRRGLGLHPLRVEMVVPRSEPQIVEMFHGNVVLVSRRASLAIGPIDGGFSHGQADFDYGLRARRAGITNVLAAGLFGTCAHDGASAPWLDPSLSTRERFRLMFGRKGLPPRSAARYLRRHGGPLWPIFWVAPYVRMLIAVVRAARPTGVWPR
jgi:GT2 family glycosyltransferase